MFCQELRFMVCFGTVCKENCAIQDNFISIILIMEGTEVPWIFLLLIANDVKSLKNSTL